MTNRMGFGPAVVALVAALGVAFNHSASGATQDERIGALPVPIPLPPLCNGTSSVRDDCTGSFAPLCGTYVKGFDKGFVLGLRYTYSTTDPCYRAVVDGEDVTVVCDPKVEYDSTPNCIGYAPTTE